MKTKRDQAALVGCETSSYAQRGLLQKVKTAESQARALGELVAEVAGELGMKGRVAFTGDVPLGFGHQMLDHLLEQRDGAGHEDGAGEADGLDSIRGALVDGRALRLGHGVRVAEDLVVEREDEQNTYVTVGRLARWVRDREVPLELCPQSNLQTGAVAAWGSSLADHPFDLLYQLGFRVTVNTDNRLMSNTSLAKELSLLTDAFGYDLDDLLAFQLNAAESAFLPLEDREELADTIVSGFEAV